MDKLRINGQDWIRLHDICDILRTVSNTPVFKNTDKVMRQIAQLMFHDEVQKAETEEEREAAREFPGDFVVYKKLGYVNPNGKKVIFFQEYKDNKEALATDNGDHAMVFEYESMAKHVAETLGEEWKTCCVGVEDGRITRRVKDNIFRDIFGEGKEDE